MKSTSRSKRWLSWKPTLTAKCSCTWDKTCFPKVVWIAISRSTTSQSSYRSKNCMDSMKSKAWRLKWASRHWEMCQGQDCMQAWHQGSVAPQVYPWTTTWSSCLSRRRVTRKERSSASTTGSRTTWREAVPSTASQRPRCIPKGTQESLWQEHSSWTKAFHRTQEWEKSSLPGMSECHQGSINSEMGFEVRPCQEGFEIIQI